MKLRHYAILMLSTCMVFLFIAQVTAQDYTTWSLPQGAKARFGKGRVKRMQYSPGGTQLAVATDIGVWVYDANSGGLLQLLIGHRDSVNSVVYSPDGNTIASNSWSEIRLWDAATGKHITTLKTSGNGAIAYSPDGKTIASTSHEGTIHLWDVDTRQLKTTIRRHTTMVFSIAYSPDGKIIAAASQDKTVSLSDATTGELINTLTGHTDVVSSVAYSPDGSTIISASTDDTVQLWDAATGEHKTTLRGHNHYVSSAVYSPDGNMIASQGWDGVFFWDLTLGEAKAAIKKSVRSTAALAYSPDGNIIAIANVDGTVDVWDAGDAQNNGIPQQKYNLRSFIIGHKKWADQLAYSPDGKTIVCANSSGIHLWNAVTGKHVATFKGHTDNINSVAYSPDGKTILGGTWDGRVHLWDAETGRYTGLPRENRLRPSDGPDPTTGHIYRRDHVTSAIYSPNGKTIVSAIDDDTVHLWDAEAGKQKNMLIGHQDLIHSLAFSPDGNTIASASKDKTVRLWDTETGKHKNTLIGHNDLVYSVAFSPDGKTIASGSAYIDNSVRLWNAETGKQKNILRTTGIVYSIVFSPDGKTIAAGTSGGIYLWDAETTRQKTRLTGYKSSVEDIAYSPDGKTLASVGSDGTMILWDLAGERKGEPIQLVADFNSDGVVNLLDAIPVFLDFITDIILIIKKLGQAMPA